MKRYVLALVAAASSSCVTAPSYQNEMLAELDRAGEELVEAAEKRGIPAFSGAREDYVAAALRDRPLLLASYQRWRAAALKIDAVGSWPEPVLSYGYFLRSVETRVGPQRHKIGVRQPVPWPSKLSKAKGIVGAQARAEREKHRTAMLRTRMTVSDLFWRAWLVGQTRHWREQQVSLLEAMSESLRARLETGRARLSDLNQIELRVSRIRDMLIALDERELQLKAALLAVVGAPQDTEAPIAATPPLVPSSNPDEGELLAAALDHPRVQVALAMKEMNEVRAEREKLDAMPDFSVGVDYIETGASPMTPPPMDDGKDPIVAMVGVKVPLWFGSYGAGRESAEADALASEATAEGIQDELSGAIRREVSRLRDARRRIALYEDVLIPQAEAAYGSVLSSYEAGDAQVAAVLLAQRELVELRIGIAEALSDLGRSQAAIEQLTAQPLR